VICSIKLEYTCLRNLRFDASCQLPKQYCCLEWDTFLTCKIYPNFLKNGGKFLPVCTVSHPEASFLQVLGCIFIITKKCAILVENGGWGEGIGHVNCASNSCNGSIKHRKQELFLTAIVTFSSGNCIMNVFFQSHSLTHMKSRVQLIL